MRKTILTAAAFLVLTSAGISVNAQATEKKETEKTTTVDAWRQSLPEGEQNSAPVDAMSESTDRVEAKETTAQIEKRILDLEGRLTEAFKGRDSVALKSLLADDFLPAGGEANAAGSQPDKNRFIEWALKNADFKSYTVEKTKVRVFPSSAVVTVYYKQQTSAAAAAGVSSENSFVATDVWVKRGKIWQAVSRHVSHLAKP